MRRLGSLVVVVAVAAVVSSCAAPPGSAGDGQAEGVVRVVGSGPVDVHVVVQPEDGDAVRVTGPLREEVRQLAGAVVVVQGRIGPSAEPVAAEEIEATDYRIVSVNGEPVLHGTVQGKTAGWTVLRTRDGETVYLSAVPESIRTGQTIWVQGQRSLVVQSYGVLR